MFAWYRLVAFELTLRDLFDEHGARIFLTKLGKVRGLQDQEMRHSNFFTLIRPFGTSIFQYEKSCSASSP